MLSSQNFATGRRSMPPNALWQRGRRTSSVRAVPPTDDQRVAFRQRLGLALGTTRAALTSYTQQAIADELSVDRDTVGRWERGEREPKSFDLHWMADLYGVDGDLFLNPPDSITELHVRLARIRRTVQEAVASAAGDVPSPLADGAADAPPGTGTVRKRPRSAKARLDQ